MKKIPLCVLAAVGASLCGCVSAPFMPPSGFVSQTKAPLSTDGNWKAGMKSGEASVRCVLGLYAWGDCSVTAAAKAGGLGHVDYLDYSYENILGIWQQVTVTAYGE